MKFLYGNSWEHYPVKRGEVWTEKQGSQVAIHDIFAPLPTFMLCADMIYSDPPWNTGNLHAFYTKADLPCVQEFSDFTLAVFECIQVINPLICYLEIGNQNFEIFLDRMKGLYPVVQSWDICYYRTRPTKLVRGGPSATTFDFTGIDDEKTPSFAIQVEAPKCVADFCMGLGCTAVSAFNNKVRFVGTELNARRLAVTIERVAKLGGIWQNGGS